MVTVDPEQVHDYANQLSRNAFMFEDLTGYITTHCNKTEGMTGILIPAAIATMFNAGLLVELARVGARSLQQLTGTLHDAAEKYRGRDVENAEQLVKSYDDSFEELPFRYTEKDSTAHSGDFTDVAAVAPNTPNGSVQFENKIKDAKDNLGIIESYAQRIIGFSVAAELLGPVFGNWDAMRENADGYKQLTEPKGVPAIRENILYGMDSLSASWEGEAATAFDFTIRRRWTGFFEFFSSCCEFQSATWEATAQESATVFDMLVFLIAESASKMPSFPAVAVLTTAGTTSQHAAGALAPGPTKEDIYEVLEFYLDFIGKVEDILFLLADVLHLWADRIRTAEASLRLVVDFADGKARIPGG